MRIVIQRVSRARLSVKQIDSVKHQPIAEIGQGLVLLIGVGRNDDESIAEWYARKCLAMRIFPDAEGKMNRSVVEIGGAILAVSQFTLYADTSRGHRPGFSDAAEPEKAKTIYDFFVHCLRKEGLEVQTGIFGAMMEVEIHNSGPVTIILDEMKKETER